MTRAEIIATVEAVCAREGWHIRRYETDGVLVWMGVEAREQGAYSRPRAWAWASIMLPRADRELSIAPSIDAYGSDECTQAVADWPEVQRMVSALRAALGAGS
jgi:hypothetical protein